MRASLLATISWLKGSLFPPNPPPFGHATIRTREGGISSTLLTARCT
jgi:hypothetical protein